MKIAFVQFIILFVVFGQLPKAFGYLDFNETVDRKHIPPAQFPVTGF
jgi:hypothetical protein